MKAEDLTVGDDYATREKLSLDASPGRRYYANGGWTRRVRLIRAPVTARPRTDAEPGAKRYYAEVAFVNEETGEPASSGRIMLTMISEPWAEHERRVALKREEERRREEREQVLQKRAAKLAEKLAELGVKAPVPFAVQRTGEIRLSITDAEYLTALAAHFGAGYADWITPPAAVPDVRDPVTA